MKPKFIFGTGYGWAATTPLFYTLTISNNIVSPGLAKEDKYLYMCDYNKKERFEKDLRMRKYNLPTNIQVYQRKAKKYATKLSEQKKTRLIDIFRDDTYIMISI